MDDTIHNDNWKHTKQFGRLLDFPKIARADSHPGAVFMSSNICTLQPHVYSLVDVVEVSESS